MEMKKPPLFFIVSLLMMLPLVSGCTENQVNPSADDFSFTTLSGVTKHLRDYRGKVVILDMWATWCSPCQLQMLELRKIYENYSRNDVEILSIDIDQRETISQIQDFISTFEDYGYELTWTFGIDDGSIWETYKVGNEGIPALCIFNREGVLSFSHEGLAVYDDIPQGYPAGLTRLAPVLDTLL